MRSTAFILVCALSPTALLAARPSLPPTTSVNEALSFDFSASGKTTIPGKSLSAGNYKISIIEHLSDRVILQVATTDGKVQSTFLGLIARTLPSSGTPGPIVWTGKGTTALRGFLFPGSPPVEFVYPKAQAVAIAKANPEKVLAIDPESDNLSVTHDTLSTQDMQIVTLWTLKSTRVGPDAEPAIEAARYQIEPASAPVSTPSSSYVAEAKAPSIRTSQGSTRASQASAAPSPAVKTTSEPVKRKPAIAVLPHTASNLPALLIAAVLSLFASALLRLRRVHAR